VLPPRNQFKIRRRSSKGFTCSHHLAIGGEGIDLPGDSQ
jgi:hypothetical protein